MSCSQLCNGGRTGLPTWPWFKSPRRHQRGLINRVYRWFYPCTERFFFGYISFSLFSQKPTFPNSNSPRNQVDEELLNVDVRLHRHSFIYPSTTDFHRFLINGRRGKTSSLAVLERFDCKQAL